MADKGNSPGDSRRIAAAITRYRTDFRAFAREQLKLQGKPFEFWPCQIPLVEDMERQWAERGFVRSVWLKARQVGSCVSQTTRILKKNLTWTTADDVVVGDEIIGVDEFPLPGKGNGRKLRRAVVLAKNQVFEPAYRLRLDNGGSLVATGEHRFLSTRFYRRRSRRKTQPQNSSWVHVRDMAVGCAIRSITTPWGDSDYEDGWFSGLLDGEGSYHKNRSGVEFVITLVAGPVFDRAVRYLTENGYTFHISVDDREPGDHSKLGTQPVWRIHICRMNEAFRILGLTRPERFLPLPWWEGKALPGRGRGADSAWPRIVEIEPLGRKIMIDLQTTTGTFIAEGFVSHNSTLAQAVIAWRTMLWPNVNAIVIADESERSKSLFEISRAFYDHLDDDIRPVGRYITKRELVFANPSHATRIADPGLRSRIVVDSAHKRNVAIGCLHPDVLVWSPDGVARLGDLKVGDRIVTHTGAVARVKAVVSRATDHRPWVSVGIATSRRSPLVCTNDHRVWTPNGWVEAGNLKPGDWIEMSFRQLDKHRTNSIDITGFYRRASPGPKPIGPTMMELSHEMGWVIGLYLAEGSLTGQASSISWRSGLTFSLGLDERDWFDRVSRQLCPWVKKMSKRESEADHSCCLFAYSTVLARMFHTWFYDNDSVCRATTKRIPEWVWGAPDEFVDGLLEGYFAGDGWWQERRGSLSATTASWFLASQIRDLLLARGLGLASLFFSPGVARKFPDGVRTTHGAWTLQLCGDGACSLAKRCGWSPVVIPGESRVWRWYDDRLLVRVKSVEPTQTPTSMIDVEVDHVDHSYRTVSCSVANSRWDAAHLSEAARFRDANFVLDGVIPAVHRVAGTVLIIESTAEMAGTWFKELCEDSQKGNTAFSFKFVPWYLQPEYFICPICHATYPKVCMSEEHEIKALRALDMTADERHIMVEFGLKPGHILWMREKLSEMGNDWDLFRQSFPLTVDDAWVIPGSQVFPLQKLRDQKMNVRPPIRLAEVFAGPRIFDAPQGRLRIWEEPQPGKAYDAGVDVALGASRDDDATDDADLSVICILERGSNKQVAEWASKSIDPFELATTVYWLGTYYNTAQVAIEVNGIGGASSTQLSKMGYGNQYIWRFRDEITPRYSRKVGWETSSRSKPWLVGFATHEMVNDRVVIRSELLLRELESYVQKGPRDWEAVAGSKDDRVSAWMIALLISDDENFAKYYGLQKTLSGEQVGGETKQKPEAWEHDGTFKQKSNDRDDLPWD